MEGLGEGRIRKEGLGGFCMGYGAAVMSLEVFVALCVLLDGNLSRSCIFVILQLTNTNNHGLVVVDKTSRKNPPRSPFLEKSGMEDLGTRLGPIPLGHLESAELTPECHPCPFQETV